MNAKDPTPTLRRLHAAAALASDKGMEAPFGFSTRIVSLTLAATPAPLAALFESMTWKALGVSCLLMLVCAASTYSLTPSSSEDDELQDPVAELLALNS